MNNINTLISMVVFILISFALLLAVFSSNLTELMSNTNIFILVVGFASFLVVGFAVKEWVSSN